MSLNCKFVLLIYNINNLGEYFPHYQLLVNERPHIHNFLTKDVPLLASNYLVYFIHCTILFCHCLLQQAE